MKVVYFKILMREQASQVILKKPVQSLDIQRELFFLPSFLKLECEGKCVG